MSSIFRDLTAFFEGPPLILPGLSLKSRSASVGAAGTYTPDLRQAVEHNITLTGATATIANPVLGAMQRAGWSNILITHVRNASGGAVTITWGSLYRQAAFTDPTDGNGVITMWHFDESTGLWYSSGRNTTANA